MQHLRYTASMIDDAADRDTEPTYRGVVQTGSKRAADLGYPTANITLIDPTLSGIYVARVQVTDDQKSYIAATFADQKRGLLEAHLLDFKGDLYGREIEVTIVEKIRDTQTFETNTALSEAISNDIKRVQSFFSH